MNNIVKPLWILTLEYPKDVNNELPCVLYFDNEELCNTAAIAALNKGIKVLKCRSIINSQ